MNKQYGSVFNHLQQQTDTDGLAAQVLTDCMAFTVHIIANWAV